MGFDLTAFELAPNGFGDKMTYEEYFKTAYLPKIIDEYVIMTEHAEKLGAYLTDHPDPENQYYYYKMLSIIERYKEFLSNPGRQK